MTIRPGLMALAVALGASSQAEAARVLVVGADDTGAVVSAGLAATGLFTQVDFRDYPASSPTSGDLAGYDAVFAYTNFVPVGASVWGDVLQQYVDGGGRLALATYAFSSPWALTGGITGAGYAPFLDSGVNAQLSGNLVKVADDAVFTGVDLASVSYFTNVNSAVPTLNAGATLLATDGTNGLIARNAAGNVYGFNMYPGLSANSGTFRLFGNALLDGGVSAVPEPATWGMMCLGMALIGAALRRRPRVASRISFAVR